MAVITIVPFREELAPAFARLNQEWIERYFRMEPSDVQALHHPQDYILATGGQIFIAMDGDTPAGAVAVIKGPDGTFELAKMAVSPEHQGRGIGEMLGHAAIDHAMALGAALVFLETNSALAPAIRLYERLGFVHAQRPEPSPYERADVYMELRFETD